jgi:hypothetical protein
MFKSNPKTTAAGRTGGLAIGTRRTGFVGGLDPMPTHQSNPESRSASPRIVTGTVSTIVAILFIAIFAHAAHADYLPFDGGKTVYVVQGPNGSFSHNTPSTKGAWDFQVAVGTTIRATGPGVVYRVVTSCPNTRSDSCGSGFGNHVEVQAGDGTCRLFAHLRNDVQVRVGQRVQRYDILGFSASSGFSTSPHLHFSYQEGCGSYRSRYGEFAEGNPQAGSYITSRNFPPSGQRGPYQLRSNNWFARRSNTSGAAEEQWNFAAPGDVPIVSNWELSDPQTEPAIFRPSTGTWHLRRDNTSGGGDLAFTFGSPGDWPILAQVDNDPDLEPCVFRRSTAIWHCRFSLTSGGGEFAFQFGSGSDQPMMADIDSDGQAEPVLYRELSGTWFYRFSNTSGGAEASFAFGSLGDVAALGQVDSDPGLEPCIRRAQTTFCRLSLSSGPGEFWFDFGDPTDWLQFGNVDADDQSEPILAR